MPSAASLDWELLILDSGVKMRLPRKTNVEYLRSKTNFSLFELSLGGEPISPTAMQTMGCRDELEAPCLLSEGVNGGKRRG
jgi:hypothetical protein